MRKKSIKIAICFAAIFFVGTLFPYAYAAVDSGLKQLRTFVTVLEYVKENYVEVTDTDQLITSALRGMVEELDDFSFVISSSFFSITCVC